MFAVRCPALNKAALVILNRAALVILNEAARRSEGSGTEHCHPERLLVILSVSEGSGVPHWSSTSAAAGDSKGDMHPDDAVESVYRGLCQSGRCLSLHRQKGKVDELIPS